MYIEATFYELVEIFTKVCHENSKAKGFWDGSENANIPTKIALLHSELSEMLEAFRNGNPPCDKPLSVIDHGEVRKMTSIEEEVADVFIRLCDLCGRLDINIARVAVEKHRYNMSREYMHGGKRV